MSKNTDEVYFSDHFTKSVSQEIIDYVTNTVLLDSRYLFVYRIDNAQFGYCTHCKNEYTTSFVVRWGKTYLQHNDIVHCPKCESVVKVKASGRGRSALIDHGYFVWYEKSLINSKAITARGIHVYRNYSGDYRTVTTQFKVITKYLFEPGVNGHLGRSTEFKRNYRDEWVQTSSISSEFYRSMGRIPHYLAKESVVSAVGDTPFQYSTWEQFLEQSSQNGYRSDLVQFFDLAARYPCVEYLSKFGLMNFVVDKMWGRQTYGAINWRGKSLDKVLGLTKAEVKELRKLPFTLTPHILHCKHEFKKKGLNLTFQQVYDLKDFIASRVSYSTYAADLDRLTEYAPYEKLIRYILKQYERFREDGKRRFQHTSTVLISLRDYLNECKELGMDLSKEHVKFPNDLHAAHRKTTVKIKQKTDQSLNVLIAERLKELEKYKFEHRGILIRPAKDTIELFEEGKELNHCVGGYSERYANGNTDLLVLRKVDTPDKPFFTMEVKDNKIIQCHGYDNCGPSPEVQAFIDAFKAEKLTKKTKQRGRKTAEQRLEVAV